MLRCGMRLSAAQAQHVRHNSRLAGAKAPGGSMRLVFINETENSTHVPGFYAVCAVSLDATKYKLVRGAIDGALDDCGWCRDHEFKGSILFSARKGDPDVATEQRVDAASSMVAATVTRANARVKCAIAWTDSGGTAETHVALVEEASSRCLPPAGDAAGKDLVVVFADHKDGIRQSDLSAAVKRAAASRGYSLVEDVVVVTSSCDVPGVRLADVLAYLGMWTYAAHKLAGKQLALFEDDQGPSQSVLTKMGVVQDVLESGAALEFRPMLA